MSNNKADISQIRKYLNGELDARAMHQLERAAQEDPFLMDALEGFERATPDQQPNLDELQQRLAKRVEPKKQRSIILWRVLPLAASLLIAISIGYWFFNNDKPLAKHTQATSPQQTEKEKAPVLSIDSEVISNKIASAPKRITRSNTVALTRPSQSLPQHRDNEVTSALAGRVAGVAVRTYKDDTTAYSASSYPVRANNTAEDLLKKLPGVDVDASGNVIAQGKQVTKVRINGKDYFGDDVAKATKNLPADVVDKIQMIDDYSDQAVTTGIKSGEPIKVLNITTKKDSSILIAQNKISGGDKDLKEVRVQIRGTGAVQKSESTASAATIDKVTNTMAFAKKSAKAKTNADSVSTLGEVVVPGYADKPTELQAQPLKGWKAYLAYVKEMAVMPDGSIGKVKLAFRVDTNGSIYGVRIIRGKTLAMNEKAISIITNGPAWIGERRSKEIRLKIKFHKKA